MIMMMIMMIVIMIITMAIRIFTMTNIKDDYDDFGLVVIMNKRTFDDKCYEK